MKYVLYILLIAVGFGLVALGDFIIGKLFPKNDTIKNGKSVRMPRTGLIFGLLLFVFGIVGILFVPFAAERFLWFGCVLVAVMGLYLLVNFFRFGIFYDDEQFIYRTLTKKAKTYRYADIEKQRAFLAKSGYNTTLYAAGDEIQLYAAMQGLSDFLHKAFYRWCDQKGIDPDTVENNPSMLVFFPED